jgi:hypothetical protein
MLAVVNFMTRNGVDICFLVADARTPIGRRSRVKDRECLVRMVAKMGGDAEHTWHALACWGQGSTCVDLSPEQCRFFRILIGDGHRRANPAG